MVSFKAVSASVHHSLHALSKQTVSAGVG